MTTTVAANDRSMRLYAPRRPVSSAPASARFVAALVSLACLAVLWVAASLPPSPAGVGSHRALGLQSCALLERTGIPCPTCGMTTSFTWFAHGNLLASAYVQPMGLLLAIAAACCVWGGAYIAITGRPLYRLLTLLPASRYLVVSLLLFILAWGWKLFLQYRGIDGWR